MKKSLLTVFSAVFMFIAAILAVSCGGGGGGGAIAAAGGNNKGKHFGSGTESGSKIQLTSNQLFSGETASMMATTSYDFIRLKVKVNGEEKTYQIQKSQNIELNIGTTIGDKLQMYAEICDASGTVLRTATSDPITIGLGTNNVVMYIIYKARLHHADGTVTEYSFTSLGSTLPADSATYPVSGYIFNAWASGPSDGTYNGMNASGVFTNSIAPGTRNDVELYAHWKLAPLEDGGVPVPGKHYANYYIDPNGAPTRVEFTEGVGIAAADLLTPTAPAGFADGTFGGWYSGFSAGTGVSGSQITSISATETADVNLYAKWTFPVNYYADPAGATSSSDTYQYGAGSSLAGTPNLPAGYAAGAEFKGWYPKDNYSASTGAGGVKATSISATQTGKVEYVARWEYKVTLYKNPANSSDTTVASYVKETGYTLPTPATPVTGFTFGGWYTTSAFTGSAVTAIPANTTGNKTYYSKWTTSVTLDYNGGKSGLDTYHRENYVQYDTLLSDVATGYTPTRPGFDFLGWNTSSTATDVFDSTAKVTTENPTYYAIWQPFTFTAYIYRVNVSDNPITYNGSTGFSRFTYTISAAALPCTLKKAEDSMCYYLDNNAVAGEIKLYGSNNKFAFYFNGAWYLCSKNNNEVDGSFSGKSRSSSGGTDTDVQTDFASNAVTP